MVKPLANMSFAYKRGLEGLPVPKYAPKYSLLYKCWLQGKKERKLHKSESSKKATQ